MNCILYCFSLNNLLDGGLYTSEITEIAGEISAGKTQVKFSGETHKLSEIYLHKNALLNIDWLF